MLSVCALAGRLRWAWCKESGSWVVQRAMARGGYDQQVDVYSAGMVLAQLLYAYTEDRVADVQNANTKGHSIVERILRESSRNSGGGCAEASPAVSVEEHLLLRMLCPQPHKRITVQQALQHPYFTQPALSTHMHTFTTHTFLSHTHGTGKVGDCRIPLLEGIE